MNLCKDRELFLWLVLARISSSSALIPANVPWLCLLFREGLFYLVLQFPIIGYVLNSTKFDHYGK